jgi:hypothetical protein
MTILTNPCCPGASVRANVVANASLDIGPDGTWLTADDIEIAEHQNLNELWCGGCGEPLALKCEHGVFRLAKSESLS